MPECLNIQNRANALLFDVSWTAGMDYNEEQFGEHAKYSNYESSDNEES